MSQASFTTDPAEKRIQHFSEVIRGLKRTEVIENAKIFLQREGAVKGEGCPFETDTFTFLRELSAGDVNKAMKVLRDTNPLVNVTSRLCNDPYAETRVFNKAGHRISLRLIERFVAEQARENHTPPVDFKSKQKVAIVGAGPSGLAAAFFLIRLGYAVTVYDNLPEAGGTLRWAFPSFRVPQDAVDRDINFLIGEGVRFKTNIMFGTSVAIADFFKHDYKAVLIATGAAEAKMLDIPGIKSMGVFSADDALLNLNLMRAIEIDKADTPSCIGQKVVVIGAGNSAFDCARSAIRLGAQATIILNGTEEDFNVRSFIAEHAREEGVKFDLMTEVMEVTADHHGFVNGVVCRQLDYADPDKSGEWNLHPVPDSEFTIEADTVIVAIGHRPSDVMAMWDKNLDINEHGYVGVNAHQQTSIDGVFACGNAVNGPGPIFKSILSGKQAATNIDNFIKNKI